MEHQISTFAPIKSMVEANDIDEQADNLVQWQQHYDQMSSGEFYGCIHQLDFKDAHIFKEYTQRALAQQCIIAPDSIWLGLPTKADSAKIDGLNVAQNQIMCQPSQHTFELITPDDFNIYGIVLKQKMLHQCHMSEAELEQIFTTAGRLSVKPEALSAAHKLIEQLLSGQAQFLKPELQYDLISAMLSNLMGQPDETSSVAPSYHHRKAVVTRVKDYLAAHPTDAVTISQLCDIAFVSRRTLQYSFESILGINPVKFIKMTRLNHIRRELKSPSSDKPISLIAANWGFFHPGQFGKDYKQLFGESPSQTVKRHRP